MWTKLRYWLLRIETYTLVALLASLISVSVIQILLRNLFSSGIIWVDSFTRVIVLWITMLGAMVASRHREHISIDILSRRLRGQKAIIITRITHLFTAVLCLVLTGYSLDFVVQEYEYGGIAFADVPHWLCESIIPIGFLVIGLRYFSAAIAPGGNK